MLKSTHPVRDATYAAIAPLIYKWLKSTHPVRDATGLTNLDALYLTA